MTLVSRRSARGGGGERDLPQPALAMDSRIRMGHQGDMTHGQVLVYGAGD